MSARSCKRHDGDSMDLEECEDCIAVMAEEEAYWRAYSGGAARIKAQVAEDAFNREEFGNDPLAAWRLKR